mgnify:CR=1 FL=1
MLTLRHATADDVPQILAFIAELAEYEREPQAATATAEDLLRDGFGDDPRFFVEIAEWDGEPAGFAFWFLNYSTWSGRAGVYLEDIFVRPAFRRRGIGVALMEHLGRLCAERGYTRLVLQVLDWNTPAIAFYESLGARPMSEWITMRIKGEALAALGSGRPTPG